MGGINIHLVGWSGSGGFGGCVGGALRSVTLVCSGSAVGPVHGGVSVGGTLGLACLVAALMGVGLVVPGAGGTGRGGFAAERVVARSRAVGVLGAVVEVHVFGVLQVASNADVAVVWECGGGVANNGYYH